MNKIVMYSIGMVGLAAVGFAAAPSLAGAQSAVGTARGNGSGYQQMIQTKAELFGLTESELTTQLETNTMLQIAEEKGISEEQFHEAMEAAARQRWAEKGLTQSEIDARLKNMEERQAGDHETNSLNRGGMGRNRFHQ
ncbi:MAG: hypothetical protein ACYDH1_18495 [Anaerolineaceae bacterium]